MLASYRWVVGCSLLVGFFAGTFLYAKPTETAQQQVLKRNHDNKTVLTIGLHGVAPLYSGKKSYGPANFELDLLDDNVFDVFCSGFDTGTVLTVSESTTTLQPLGGLGTKPATPTRRRYRLQPC
jgi:hypothetical protein